MAEELERSTFKVIDKEGNEVECEVLFEFSSEETNKSYIVYTDHTKDENGNIQIFANVFDPDKESGKLEPIETDKEWKIIESILESLKEAQADAEAKSKEQEE